MTEQTTSSSIANDLVRELIKEKRSAKRWKNFRFIVWFIVIGLVLAMILTSSGLITLGTTESKGYVALMRLDGMIEPGRDFSSENVIPRLRQAFTDPEARGVILDINSGGGTPVQASIIHDAILEMKTKYHKKIIVVGEDVLASGAYYVAVAADKIYVNANTVTGSIGVIMKGFGFPDLIKKIGVERRVYTSGANKDRLDPFLPQNQQDIEKIQAVIKEVHDNFNQVVLKGRAGKLHASAEELFTGDFWSGQTALKLGLVDGLGNLSEIMRDEFHVSRYRDYSVGQGFLKSFTNQFGMAISAALDDDGIKVLEKI